MTWTAHTDSILHRVALHVSPLISVRAYQCALRRQGYRVTAPDIRDRLRELGMIGTQPINANAQADQARALTFTPTAN